MKLIQLTIALLVFLTMLSCTSQPTYRKAEDGGFGYSETKLTDTQYRVNFKARGSDKTKAMDYAMLRAAQVAQQNGYQWFNVEQRETLIDKERVQPQVEFRNRYARVTECGLLSCRTTFYPHSSFSSGIFVGGSQKSEIDVTLHVRMGSQNMPDAAFDASQLIENLAPLTETEK